MEYFDLYNEEGHPLGKVATRHQSLGTQEYFLVVHVWIENEDKEFLIQKRAKKNDPIPHQWAITSGIPNSKETPLDAAIRETKEELGITLDKKQLKKRALIVSNHNQYNTITHVYHTYEAVELDRLRIDKKEVIDTQYADLKKILKMVETKDFWDYRSLLGDSEYFEMLKRND